MELPREVRSRRGGLNALCDLEKWKTSIFPCLITSPNYSRSKDIIW